MTTEHPLNTTSLHKNLSQSFLFGTLFSRGGTEQLGFFAGAQNDSQKKRLSLTPTEKQFTELFVVLIYKFRYIQFQNFSPS
jgi:hypothetical protein